MTTKPRKVGILGSMQERMASLDDGDDDLPAPPLSHAARSAPAQLLQATGMHRDLEELKKQKASGVQLRLSQLRPSPYQRGGLVESRVVALMGNLEKNPLSSPVVVRATAEDDVYELVAGHHRAEAFRRLNRSEISAVVRELSDDEAERVVFYDNLFAPELTDYDKYLGFAARKASRGYTQEQLAQEAGVPQSVVSRLLSIEKLPAAAQAFIKENAHQPGISARLFQSLTPLSDSHPERVVEAVQRVAQGRLNVLAAADWVTTTEKPAPAPASKMVFKRGKQRYAEMRSRGAQVVISFASEAEARECNERLLELLQRACGATP